MSTKKEEFKPMTLLKKVISALAENFSFEDNDKPVDFQPRSHQQRQTAATILNYYFDALAVDSDGEEPLSEEMIELRNKLKTEPNYFIELENNLLKNAIKDVLDLFRELDVVNQSEIYKTSFGNLERYLLNHAKRGPDIVHNVCKHLVLLVDYYYPRLVAAEREDDNLAKKALARFPIQDPKAYGENSEFCVEAQSLNMLGAAGEISRDPLLKQLEDGITNYIREHNLPETVRIGLHTHIVPAVKYLLGYTKMQDVDDNSIRTMESLAADKAHQFATTGILTVAKERAGMTFWETVSELAALGEKATQLEKEINEAERAVKVAQAKKEEDARADKENESPNVVKKKVKKRKASKSPPNHNRKPSTRLKLNWLRDAKKRSTKRNASKSPDGQRKYGRRKLTHGQYYRPWSVNKRKHVSKRTKKTVQKPPLEAPIPVVKPEPIPAKVVDISALRRELKTTATELGGKRNQFKQVFGVFDLTEKDFFDDSYMPIPDRSVAAKVFNHIVEKFEIDPMQPDGVVPAVAFAGHGVDANADLLSFSEVMANPKDSLKTLAEHLCGNDHALKRHALITLHILMEDLLGASPVMGLMLIHQLAKTDGVVNPTIKDYKHYFEHPEVGQDAAPGSLRAQFKDDQQCTHALNRIFDKLLRLETATWDEPQLKFPKLLRGIDGLSQSLIDERAEPVEAEKHELSALLEELIKGNTPTAIIEIAVGGRKDEIPFESVTCDWEALYIQPHKETIIQNYKDTLFKHPGSIAKMMALAIRRHDLKFLKFIKTELPKQFNESLHCDETHVMVVALAEQGTPEFLQMMINEFPVAIQHLQASKPALINAFINAERYDLVREFGLWDMAVLNNLKKAEHVNMVVQAIRKNDSEFILAIRNHFKVNFSRFFEDHYSKSFGPALVAQRDPSFLKTLLRGAPEIVDTVKGGPLPLVFSYIRKGKQNMIEALNEVNPEILLTRVGKALNSVVHFAVNEGSLDTLKHLYKLNPLCIKFIDANGESIAHMAAKTGNIELLDWINEVDPELLDFGNKHKNSPVHHAARLGKIEVLDWFYANRKTAFDLRNNCGDTIAHSAAWRNKISVLEWLKQDEHSDLHRLFEEIDSEGLRPVDWAVTQVHLESLEWFKANFNEDSIAKATNDSFKQGIKKAKRLLFAKGATKETQKICREFLLLAARECGRESVGNELLADLVFLALKADDMDYVKRFVKDHHTIGNDIFFSIREIKDINFFEYLLTDSSNLRVKFLNDNLDLFKSTQAELSERFLSYLLKRNKFETFKRALDLFPRLTDQHNVFELVLKNSPRNKIEGRIAELKKRFPEEFKSYFSYNQERLVGLIKHNNLSGLKIYLDHLAENEGNEDVVDSDAEYRKFHELFKQFTAHDIIPLKLLNYIRKRLNNPLSINGLAQSVAKQCPALLYQSRFEDFSESESELKINCSSSNFYNVIIGNSENFFLIGDQLKQKGITVKRERRWPSTGTRFVVSKNKNMKLESYQVTKDGKLYMDFSNVNTGKVISISISAFEGLV